ncbi:unnamed protein product [Musa hybrid cultivar]
MGGVALASWKRIPSPSHRLGFCGSQSGLFNSCLFLGQQSCNLSPQTSGRSLFHFPGNFHQYRGATSDIANMEEDTVDSNPSVALAAWWKNGWIPR